MISFFFSRYRRGADFLGLSFSKTNAGSSEIVAVHWSLCQRSQAESSMDRHDRCIPNSIRILGGRTREGIWVGSQSRLSCPQDRRCGTLLRRGQIFSEFRHPPLGDHRRVRRCLVVLGGVFTTWHFIVVNSAQQGCAKDGKAELPGKDPPAIGRNTCGGLSTVLCRTATSAARMDDHVASVSAQTILGGVLGGNFGVLYDDYAKGRFVSGCAINKEDE